MSSIPSERKIVKLTDDLKDCPYHGKHNKLMVKMINTDPLTLHRRDYLDPKTRVDHRFDHDHPDLSIGMIAESCRSSDITRLYIGIANGVSYKAVIRVFNHDCYNEFGQLDEHGDNRLHREIRDGKLYEAMYTAERIDLRVTNRDGLTPLSMVINARAALLQEIREKYATYSTTKQCSVKK